MDWAKTSSRTLMLVFCFPVVTCAVESLLVFLLLIGFRVSENSFAISHFKLCLLRSRKSAIHHHLIIPDKVHLPRELRVEVILTLTVDVTLLLHGCCVTHVSLTESVHPLVVLSQIVVERALSMGWSILNAKTSRHVRNVSVSTASIIDVNDRLRVNVCQVASWTLFGVIEST